MHDESYDGSMLRFYTVSHSQWFRRLPTNAEERSEISGRRRHISGGTESRQRRSITNVRYRFIDFPCASLANVDLCQRKLLE